MSEGSAPSSSVTPPSRRAQRRVARPRLDRVDLSLSRHAVRGLVGLAGMMLTLSFFGGFWLGRGSRSGVTACESEDSSRSVNPDRSSRSWGDADGARSRAAADAPPIVPLAPREAETDGSDPSETSGARRPSVPRALGITIGTPKDARVYGVQVGAHPSVEEAKASLEPFVETLSGQAIYIVPVEVQGRGTWHRVRIGAFVSKDEAEAMRRALPQRLAAGAMVVPYHP